EQIRNSDLWHDALRSCRLVILLGVAKAEARRRDGIVEFPNGPDRAEAIARVALRKQAGLAGIARKQSSHEPPLVQVVLPAFQSIGASRKVQGRANGCYTAQRCWCAFTKFAGHFANKVPTHGIAGKENLGKSIRVDQLFEDPPVIAAHSGVVERWSQQF